MGILQASEARYEVLAERAAIADLDERVRCLETLLAKLMFLTADLAGAGAKRRAS